MELQQILDEMKLLSRSGETSQVPKLKTFSCCKCNDLEFIEVNGVMVECNCRAKKQYERRVKKAKLTGVIERYTFKGFKTESEEQQKVLATVVTYFKKRLYKPNTGCNLIISGQVGSGKTHLAMALSNNILAKGDSLYYMDYRSYMTEIKTKLIDLDAYRKLIDIAKEVDVLYIDDLYKGKVTETDYNILYEILNYRYMKQLVTIITTELSIQQILEKDEGIGSRLYTRDKDILVNMNLENYRLKIKK